MITYNHLETEFLQEEYPMKGLSLVDLTRRFPTIGIAVMASFAVIAVLVGDVGEQFIYTFAGNGEDGTGGDGGPATEAQLSSPWGRVLDGSDNLYVTDPGSHRVRAIRLSGEIDPVTQKFPHCANGDSTLSDLVLVNVDTKTIAPAVRFYGSTEDPISADSVVDPTDDLELVDGRRSPSWRAVISYSDLAHKKIKSCTLGPHDPRLAQMLGDISTEEDEAGRGMLSVVVVHKTGDQKPGTGFFKLAQSLGHDVTEEDMCWAKELKKVHDAWSR